jgi:flagellar motor switch protein FliG
MVIEEFVEMASARQYILDGGIDYAKNLLTKALGTQRAMEIMDVLNQIQQKERPFAIARKADPHQLYNLLINEHPQTVALILCYIQPDKAAIVLSQFPSELQTEVAERIGMINRTSPSIIKKIEKIMEAKFSNIIDSESETIGGVKSLVDILNSVDRSTERNIIGNLETNQPDLAEIVKSNLFIFEDIVNLDRSSIQRILREVSNEDLALALKGASEKVVNVVFSNMSKRAAEMLKEDIQFMGPVRLSTVEEAQFKIVGIIRRLDEVGEIIIGRGDQDTVIV